MYKNDPCGLRPCGPCTLRYYHGHISTGRVLAPAQIHVGAAWQPILPLLSFQGLFSITQARYSMGALGQQQYDAEMQATATVTVVEDGE